MPYGPKDISELNGPVSCLPTPCHVGKEHKEQNHTNRIQLWALPMDHNKVISSYLSFIFFHL